MKRRVRLLKGLVWGLGLFPLAQVGWWLRDGIFGLGANPIERVLHHSGWWALALLLATLAITPLRRLTRRNELVKLRRPLGLFAFFWATVHLAIYLGLDQLFAWDFILEDIAERPFITVGFLGWLLLVPLAVTSTRGWIRRLGRRWSRLHRLAYLVAILGLIHYYWRVRADSGEPLVFAAVFVALMALRMQWTRRPGQAFPARSGKERSRARHGAERGRPAAGGDRETTAGAGAR
ncbi:MAG: sulfoxide reductase heme-binding subunit YedZ [Gemmatimonadota bacterium]